MLRIFNKKTKEWTSQKSDLPLDKVFKINDKYYARGWQEVKPHTIHYSLFSEGLHSNKLFDSKYVQDLWDDKILYIDSKNNLSGFKLYVNSSLYSDTHSNALFDKNGNIYFFKQKHNVRTLYKNKKPLFSYSGYYGSLLGIESNGTIYFTGSSPYGSSVYQYKKGKISRSVPSDTVIQAKTINNKEFIACEVTPYGYEYKIIPKKLSQKKPVLYKYQFKKRKPLQIAKNKDGFSADNSLSKNPLPTNQTVTSQKETLHSNTDRQISAAVTHEKKTAALKYKDYSSLKHIRYKGGNFQSIVAGYINIFSTNFLFSDYLLHHIIIPGYITAFPTYHLEDGLHLISLSYQNRVYPLEWKSGYQMALTSNSSFSPDTDSSSDTSSLSTEHKGYLRLNYPLFKKGRWFSSISSLKLMELLEKSSKKYSRGLWRGQINWGYSQSFPYNYAPNKSSVFSVFVDNRYDFKREANGLKSGAIWDSIFHLGSEFYIFPSVSYARSFKPTVNPVQVSLYNESAGFKDSDYENLSASFHSSDPKVTSFEDLDSSSFITGDIYGPLFKSRYKAKSIGATSLGLKKAYNISLGEWKSRFTPLMRVRWLILEDLFSYDTKSDSSDNIVTFGDDPLDKDISTKHLQKLVELSEKKEEKKTKKVEQYIQWLEWTFGFEFEFMVLNQARLILGSSFGFRTPLKFWEDNDPNPTGSGSSSDGDSIGGSFDDISSGDSTKSVRSAFTNIYLKMPL